MFLAGFEHGLTPDDHMFDGPISVGGWKPGNYENNYQGDVSLREAFAQSLNSVAVQVSERVGRKNVVEAARRLGITSDLDDGPSIALGSSEVTLLELTGAYATFDNGGYGVWPRGIEQISDRNGSVLYQREGTGPGLLVEPQQVLRDAGRDDRRGRYRHRQRGQDSVAPPPARPAPARTSATPGSSASRPSW